MSLLHKIEFVSTPFSNFKKKTGMLGAGSAEPASRGKFDPRKDFLKNSDDGVLGDGSTSPDLPPPDIPGPAALV